MAGSTFNPLDLVPSSLRPRQSPKTRASLPANARHGGRTNSNLPLQNLVAYQASFLHRFDDQSSAASLSSNLPIPQDDSYQQMNLNEEHQQAIQALSDVPDDVVLQQLALTRFDHASSSNRLATVPESSPYPFPIAIQPIAAVPEMLPPPLLTNTLPQPSASIHQQGPWERNLRQPRSPNVPSLSTDSWSAPSIFTHISEASTMSSSRHVFEGFPSPAPVLETGSLAAPNEASVYTMAGTATSPGHSEIFPAGPENSVTNDPLDVPARSRTSAASIKYLCTICDSKATFRGKSEWKRHEISHMPSIEYICLPDGPTDQESRCTICGIYHPDIQHVIEHHAHTCLAKDEAARTWVRKDKFVKHLASHGLSSDCAQVARWSRRLPPRISGCGFCVRGFNDSNERSLHVAKHFESGCDRTEWDRSKVILGLLSQPRTALSWQSLLGATFKGQPAPPISWSSALAPEIQKRLEEGQENGHDLALAAFQSSSLCRPPTGDQLSSNQQDGPIHDPNEDTVHRVEHLLNGNMGTFAPETSQSWFDDSEQASEFVDLFGGSLSHRVNDLVP